MNNKYLAAAGVVLILLVAAFFFGSGSGNVIGDGIALYRTTYLGEVTEQGFVYIPFEKTTEEYDYANVALDINGDGAYAGYDVSGTHQEEWLVRKMPA